MSPNEALNSPQPSEVGSSLNGPDDYFRSLGAILAGLAQAGGDIASAATLTIPVSGALFNVTGTATINGLSNSFIGRKITLVFAGACALNSSANLQIVGGNTTTVALDVVEAKQVSATRWVAYVIRGNNFAGLVTGSELASVSSTASGALSAANSATTTANNAQSTANNAANSASAAQSAANIAIARFGYVNGLNSYTTQITTSGTDGFKDVTIPGMQPNDEIVATVYNTSYSGLNNAIINLQVLSFSVTQTRIYWAARSSLGGGSIFVLLQVRRSATTPANI